MTTGHIKMAGTLRRDFTGEAANDPHSPLWRQLLAITESQQNTIAQYFREEISSILKDMNLDAALTRQAGKLSDGTPLGGHGLAIEKTTIGVWLRFDKETWDGILDSHIDDLRLNDRKLFETLYSSAGPACVQHFQDTGTHLDHDAVRLAFEDSFKDRLTLLSLVCEIMQHHLPGTTVASEILHDGDAVVPVVHVQAPDGQDLRDIVRTFLDKKTRLTDVKPRP